MTEHNVIHWERGADGIVVLTMDDPGQSANTMNAAYALSMRATVDRLEAERDTVTGVILTSAKKTFFVGGDLNDMIKIGPQDALRFFTFVEGIKADLRRLEQLGRPVVSAINGSALGGGLEIALSCHHRIALDAKGSRIGLPEATLGLLPGAGGVTRTVRMLGVTETLSRVLLQGLTYPPAAAEELGLLDAVVSTREDMLAAARSWIAAHPEAAQPWDANGHKVPGGTPAAGPLSAILPSLPATLRKQTGGANLPARRAILAAAVEGAQVDGDTALATESRYLVELVTGQVAKNMIKGSFFDMQHTKAGGSRPDGHPQHTARKVVVLGAGMMGAGIAHACARAGLDVVLKDTTLARAEKGRAYSARVVDKAVARGSLTRGDADLILGRTHPSDRAAGAAGADLVIEAVFEDRELKRTVF
uniref:enoyl-CoA hydratase-related protein n=1 Tax=Streptomyces sp. GbtcB7 TaxID=2824752 RepID=UPI001C2F7A63